MRYKTKRSICGLPVAVARRLVCFALCNMIFNMGIDTLAQMNSSISLQRPDHKIICHWMNSVLLFSIFSLFYLTTYFCCCLFAGAKLVNLAKRQHFPLDAQIWRNHFDTDKIALLFGYYHRIYLCPFVRVSHTHTYAFSLSPCVVCSWNAQVFTHHFIETLLLFLRAILGRLREIMFRYRGIDGFRPSVRVLWLWLYWNMVYVHMDSSLVNKI